MAWLTELAKVLIGVFAADFAFHTALLLAKEQPRILGIKFSNKMNGAAVAVNIILIALLAWLAWF